MNKTHLLVIIVFTILGCQDLAIPEIGNPRIVVVEGWLTDQNEIQEVTLSYSAQFGDNQISSPIISASMVIVTLPGVDEYKFMHMGNGLYRSVEAVQMSRTSNYQLRVTLENGDEIISAIQRAVSISNIDSLYYLSYERENPITDLIDIIYYPVVRTKDSIDVNNYYRWRASRNDTLLNRSEDITILSDQFFDGNEINNELTSFEFQLGDKILIEQQQISEDAFNFLTLIKQQTTLLGTVNSTSPARISSNLSYTSKNESVLGYWGLISIDSDTITVN